MLSPVEEPRKVLGFIAVVSLRGQPKIDRALTTQARSAGAHHAVLARVNRQSEPRGKRSDELEVCP